MIDLRSDTVTTPTRQMLDAMISANVGDDILREDISVQELESLAAQITGKEAALFTVSGTMSNQIAAMAFTQRGEEIIAGAESHIYNLEAGGLAALSQVQVKPISISRGNIPFEEITSAIRLYGVQSPKTGLICLENTYNLNRGYTISVEDTNKLANLAHQYTIPLYLDGARIFNAAAKLQVPVAQLCKSVDAVQFCLTKGLAAPFGAMLCGTAEFIEKARWMKQRLGGGFRQAGYMAAAGSIAIRLMQQQIAEDNEKASILATNLQNFDMELVHWGNNMTNIICLDLNHCSISEECFIQKLLEKNIKIKVLGKKQYRMVCHKDISWDDINIVEKTIKEILR